MPHVSARRLGVACLMVLAAVMSLPAASTAKQGPVISTFPLALAYSWLEPGLDPRGAGDFACRPSAAHPRPVVLLHGTYANKFNSFAAMAPAIRRQGYCVFALDYGRGKVRGLNGARALRSSSKEVASYVDRVLAATGAAQVDLVGYSQGALAARAYLRYDGGADATDPARNKVHGFIGLSALNHGTTLGGLLTAVRAFGLSGFLAKTAGQSAADVERGSPFLTDLGSGGETLPGISYTLIATEADEVNVPASQAFLDPSAGGRVTNTMLQAGCPTDRSDHFNLTYSPRAIALTLRALDPASTVRLPCTVQLPGV